MKMSATHPYRLKEVPVSAYLFVAVLAFRLYGLAKLTESQFLLPNAGDMQFYDDWALRILRGNWTDHTAFYGLPLYAYVLAAIYWVCGHNPFVPGFLQAGLDAGTAVLVYQMGALVFAPADETSALRRAQRGKLIGLLAAIGWACFQPAQAYSIILMPTAWLVFVFWFVVWQIVKRQQVPALRMLLLLGGLMGFTAMGIATILFFVPLLLAALFLRWKGSFARRVAGAGVIMAGLFLGTSPAWIHNCFIARDPVFLSAHGGINFWIGNNPDANGYPRFPPGLHAGQAAMLQDSINAAESAAGHPLKRAEVSEFWSHKARNYIAGHPLDWVGLLLTKLRNFWSAFRYDDLSIVTDLREHRVILPGISFGLIAAFGIPGMLLGWRRSPVSRWVTAAILLQMAALMPVFVTERYRLPIVPGLLICATFGLLMFWQSLVQTRYSQSVIYLTLLGLATVFVSWPQGNPALWALDSYNSGIQALELGREALDRHQPDAAAADFATANTKLQKAFAYVPDNAELNFALGELRQVEGQITEAKSFYATALQSDPRHERAFNNLGLIALDEQHYPLAESFFRRSLEVDPTSAKTHFLLGKTFWAAGQREPARREVDIAIALSPSQREFRDLRDQITRPESP